MNSLELGHGIWPFVFLFVAGFVATEPWRYLGIALASRIDVDSEILKWVRAVSTALVAGLVTRMILFPVGAFADVPLTLRIGAFCAGVAGFYVFRRKMAFGVLTGVFVLISGQFLLE